MYPVLFRIGPLTVYSFGVFMALGFYVAATFAAKEYQRRGGEPEPFWNLVVWIFLAGLVSSRVLSLLNDPMALVRDPIGQILSGAGFVWYGGLIGGTAVALLLTRRYRIPFGTLIECCAPALAIGQAIGRLGCHVAGDGDWGTVTELPWGVAYTQAIVGWEHAPGVTVHPTPLYEAAAYGAIFLWLWRLRTRDLPTGTLFSLYLVAAGSARLAVEFIRLNPKFVLGLTQAQLVAIALIVGGGLWLARNRANVVAAYTARA